MKPDRRSTAAGTNKQEPPPPPPPPIGGAETVNFLEKLRPGGPWLLVAIDPDNGDITARTKTTAEAVREFVAEHNGVRNLYYSLNPTRKAIHNKAKKTDLAAIEYLPADLDPQPGETPQAAKVRYLAAIEKLTPQPAAIIDSGNGLNVLLKLAAPILLPKPITVIVDDEPIKQFPPGTEQQIAEAEERARLLMEKLGSVAGTQNIDRILRLPGTTNLPTKKKMKDGRVACPATLIKFNGATCTLEDFPKPAMNGGDGGGPLLDDFAAGILSGIASVGGAAADDTPEPKKPKVARAPARGKPDSQADRLEQIILDPDAKAFDGDRSKAVWYVICEMLRRGFTDEAIINVLVAPKLPISAHIRDQSGKPEDVARRQLNRAKAALDFARNDKGKVVPTVGNTNIALAKLQISTRYDEFAGRVLIDGMGNFSFGHELSDAAVDQIWATCSLRFQFQPHKDLLVTVLGVNAHRNSFHPVRDYLDDVQARWDGEPRVDRWLIDYAGAEDTAYVRAVSALPLLAAVRRVRQPGCKFDETLILEQPVQGTDKSSALAILAVHEDWFSDGLPLHGNSKEIIEATRGRWLIEISELSGMKKADLDHLKSMLSTRVDHARMAYGRLPIDAPRQWVPFGTTNKEIYLRDTTGNRRFWPVRIERFKLDELRRDRDQLWGEAAAREATGESIRLAPALWPIAAKEQNKRLADDPFVSILGKHLGDLEGKIRTADIWTILNINTGQLHQEHFIRVSDAMKKIGWTRPNSGKQLRFSGVRQSAYTRGDATDEIVVTREPYGGLRVFKPRLLPLLGAQAKPLLKDDPTEGEE